MARHADVQSLTAGMSSPCLTMVLLSAPHWPSAAAEAEDRAEDVGARDGRLRTAGVLDVINTVTISS